MPAVRTNQRSLPALPTLLSTTQPPSTMEPNPNIRSRDPSREPSPPFGRGPEYTRYEFRPQLPPSPPLERSNRVSLPPIATLLGTPQRSPVQQKQASPQLPTSNGVHRCDFARGALRLKSPPTPPSRHEYIDIKNMSHVPQPPKRGPPTHSPYPNSHCMRRASSLDRQQRSSAHRHRSSRSSNSNASMVSTRATSPTSIHSAPVDIPKHQTRVAMPTVMAKQRPLTSEYTPLTPYSPPSTTSIRSATSEREIPWHPPSHHHHHHHHPHHLLPTMQTYGHGNTRPVSLSYQPSAPPQTTHGFMAGAMATQTQLLDRYICPSCAKAFSRPSSLRIHVHSHTGEKPFRCPHKGCGKAFSVRSNMKRHQKGCHVDACGACGERMGGFGEKMEVQALS